MRRTENVYILDTLYRIESRDLSEYQSDFEFVLHTVTATYRTHRRESRSTAVSQRLEPACRKCRI